MTPGPLPAKVRPPELLITPEKVILAVALLVMVRTEDSRATPPEKTTEALVFVFESPKSPPTTILGFAKVRLPVPLLKMVPPLMFRTLKAPPKLLLPLTPTVPALSVKLLPAAEAALPWAPMSQVPFPLLVQIWLAAVALQFCPAQFSVTPSATFTVLPPDFVLTVPPAVIVVLPLTVMSPTVAVAKVTRFVPPLAVLKITVVVDTQLLLKVPDPVVFQTALVQVAFVPFV
jgi:hypothetical protein